MHNSSEWRALILLLILWGIQSDNILTELFQIWAKKILGHCSNAKQRGFLQLLSTDEQWQKSQSYQNKFHAKVTIRIDHLPTPYQTELSWCRKSRHFHASSLIIKGKRGHKTKYKGSRNGKLINFFNLYNRHVAYGTLSHQVTSKPRTQQDPKKGLDMYICKYQLPLTVSKYLKLFNVFILTHVFCRAHIR